VRIRCNYLSKKIHLVYNKFSIMELLLSSIIVLLVLFVCVFSYYKLFDIPEFLTVYICETPAEMAASDLAAAQLELVGAKAALAAATKVVSDLAAAKKAALALAEAEKAEKAADLVNVVTGEPFVGSMAGAPHLVNCRFQDKNGRFFNRCNYV
jgi:hypothetical protein